MTRENEPTDRDDARPERDIDHELTDVGKDAPDDLGGTGGEQSGGAG